MSLWYNLEGDTPVPVNPDEVDLVNRWKIVTKVGLTKISTVFMAINHGGNDNPILFETIIFGGALDGDGERYHTKAQAEKGHERWIKIIENLPAAERGM